MKSFCSPSFPISSVWLRTDGDDVVVLVKIGDRWIEIARDYAGPLDGTICRQVTSLGIQSAIEQTADAASGIRR